VNDTVLSLPAAAGESFRSQFSTFFNRLPEEIDLLEYA
jgi:hypothetical protein